MLTSVTLSSKSVNCVYCSNFTSSVITHCGFITGHCCYESGWNTLVSTGWMGWGSKLSGGEIFRTVQTGTRVHPPSCTMGIDSLSWGLSGKGEVKERVELYLYSTSGLSWTVWSEFYLLFFMKPTSLFAGAHPIKTLAKHSVTLSS
jgi:hypothetical protein